MLTVLVRDTQTEANLFTTQLQQRPQIGEHILEEGTYYKVAGIAHPRQNQGISRGSYSTPDLIALVYAP